jgi:hypothetical protein
MLEKRRSCTSANKIRAAGTEGHDSSVEAHAIDMNANTSIQKIARVIACTRFQ